MPSTPASSPAREARDVVREFGILRAVDGISFSLQPGEFLAVFGPNGAGKTSLLRLLAGEIRPTSGTVTIGGRALSGSDQDWRQQVGMLSHQSFLYDHLTAEENLSFYGRLFLLDDLSTFLPPCPTGMWAIRYKNGSNHQCKPVPRPAAPVWIEPRRDILAIPRQIRPLAGGRVPRRT